jgi:UDP-N-acetylglucosamine acyltransferase
MPTVIHPTAIIEKGAQLGVDCEVHPYAIVKKGAVLGDRVVVHPFSVVGGDSQDLKFDPAVPSGVRIGPGTKIRESVTVNRSTVEGSFTEVGSDCLLMACCHVAHDCVVGNRVVIANCALLAGHVHVGDHAVLGGGALLHQFLRVGRGAMVGGGARCTLDIPPFAMAAERDEVVGLNLVGLRRQGYSADAIRELKEAFRAVYFTAGNIRDTAAATLAGGGFREAPARLFLEFFAGGKRGFSRARRTKEAGAEA